MAQPRFYRDFLEFDRHSPVISPDSIRENEARDPDFWTTTYPHESFVSLVNAMMNAIDRRSGGVKSIWIEGAYGTGKSHCAYGLERLLTAPEEKVRYFWRKYPRELSDRTELCDRLCKAKREKRIVTASLYDTSKIINEQKFFLYIQKTVSETLVRENLPYHGGETLFQVIQEWFEVEVNRLYFDSKLQGKASRYFENEESADDIRDSIRRYADNPESYAFDELVSGILRFAEENDITILHLDVDRLKAWLADVVAKNNICFVFFWDEFSEFFRHVNGLTSFQSLSELCHSCNFYFVYITHSIKALGDQWPEIPKIVDRFSRVDVQLPENIALRLIGHVLKPKKEYLELWHSIDKQFNHQLSKSRNALMKAIGETDQEVIKGIMPFHPIAAIALKLLATDFKSNTRSMFDFITADDDDVQAFQWFIKENSPYNKDPFVSVDYLWSFFYDKNRQDLSQKVRQILDVYKTNEDMLDETERKVLKTVLIMQAIGYVADINARDEKNTLGADLLLTTEENLSLAFEGIQSLDKSGVNVVQRLAKPDPDKGRPRAILFAGMLGKKTVYTANEEAEPIPVDVSVDTSTDTLIKEGDMHNLLDLRSEIKLRFTVDQKPIMVTAGNIEQQLDKVRSGHDKYKGRIALAVAIAQNEQERKILNEKILKYSINPQYFNVVFVDATSVLISNQDLSVYKQNIAYARQLQKQGKSKDSQKAGDDARQVLKNWASNIVTNKLTVYWKSRLYSVVNKEGVCNLLREIGLNHLHYAFELRENRKKRFTESMLNNDKLSSCALFGLITETDGMMRNSEQCLFPEFESSNYWPSAQYWKETPSAPISQIKIKFDAWIKDQFELNPRIEVGRIWRYLQDEFAFLNSNIYALLVGFLLKDYCNERSRLVNSKGKSQSGTTKDKETGKKREKYLVEILAEEIGRCVGEKEIKADSALYLMQQSREEKAVYSLVQTVFEKRVTTPEGVIDSIYAKLIDSALPADFAIEGLSGDARKVFKALCNITEEEKDKDKRINAVDKCGKALLNYEEEHVDVASPLKKMFFDADTRREFFVKSLKCWDGGSLWNLAKAISSDDSATEILVDTVMDRFRQQLVGLKAGKRPEVLFDEETRDELLRKIESEYRFIRSTNNVFGMGKSSLNDALELWFEKIPTIFISLKSMCEDVKRVFSVLAKFYRNRQQKEFFGEDETESVGYEFTPDFIAALDGAETELPLYLTRNHDLFLNQYNASCDGLLPTGAELDALIQALPSEMLLKSEEECVRNVKSLLSDARKSALTQEALRMWRGATGTESPREWSQNSKLPVLCMFSESDEKEAARGLVNALNAPEAASKAAIEQGIEFMKRVDLRSILSADANALRQRFSDFFLNGGSRIIGYDRALNELLANIPNVDDWLTHTTEVNDTLDVLVDEVYSDRIQDVTEKIERMSPERAKAYLKDLVSFNSTVGIEILLDEGANDD